MNIRDNQKDIIELDRLNETKDSDQSREYDKNMTDIISRKEKVFCKFEGI